MPRVIHIRGVPDDLHRRLKSRAALAGLSLSDYLLGQIREAAEHPSLDELRARLAARPEAALPTPPAAMIRDERNGC